MTDYKIDEVNVLENYIMLLENMEVEEGEEITAEELLEIAGKIKKMKKWIREIKSTGETHKDLKWKIDMLDEILDCEKNIEIISLSGEKINAEEEDIQRDYIEGIEKWLADLKKVKQSE